MNKFSATPAPQKPFSFSWSKVKNFETCPRKHLEVDILKNYQETSEALDYGNAMHEAARKRVVEGTPLPAEFSKLEPWIKKITNNSDAANVSIMTELKLAITRAMKPCAWFAKDAYFRGVIDFLKLIETANEGMVALAVDYKSGQVKDDIPQLGLFSQLVFSHFPRVKVIKTMYIWVNADDSNEMVITPKDMPDLWAELNPRVKALELAYKTDNFPPRRSGLCLNWCPVSTCEYNGRQ